LANDPGWAIDTNRAASNVRDFRPCHGEWKGCCLAAIVFHLLVVGWPGATSTVAMTRRSERGTRPLTVAQVSTADVGGGAERIAADLHEAYGAAGWEARLLVGTRLGSASNVVELPNDDTRGRLARAGVRLGDALQPHSSAGAQLLRAAARPRRAVTRLRGHEDFDFRGTRVVVDAAREVDLVHLHNLHGNYFDLRLLPAVSAEAAVLLTLHDGWLMSGHCAHSLGCDRWVSGCGHCPDLSLYPALLRDGTAENWRRKQAIMGSVRRLHLATPSAWLMDRVHRSLLADHVVESKVIPNGVDVSVFAPRDRARARAGLGLPVDATIILAAANGLRSNAYKDYATLEASLRTIAADTRQDVLVLMLGDAHEDIRLGSMTLRFIPMIRSADVMAAYYNSADLFVHAARADTFPTAVLEALASGLPVVGSRVGGIPEQVISHGPADHTGLLVPPADPGALAAAIRRLLDDPRERKARGAAAARDARTRFDGARQAQTYIEWATQIVVGHGPPGGAARRA